MENRRAKSPFEGRAEVAFMSSNSIGEQHGIGRKAPKGRSKKGVPSLPSLPQAAAASSRYSTGLGNLTSRIMGLPEIMCNAADGDSYMMSTGTVQQTMWRKHAGVTYEEVQSVIKGRPMPKGASHQGHGHQGHLRLAPSGSVGTNADGSPRLPHIGRQRSVTHHLTAAEAHILLVENQEEKEEVDPEVLAHVAGTEAMLDEYRAMKAAERDAERARKAAAKRRARKATAQEEASEEEPEANPEEEKKSGLPANSHWRMAQDIVQANLEVWRHNQERSSKWKSVKTAVNWTSMLGMTELYVQRRLHHQGTAIYELRCQELGVVPSTQVLHQLLNDDANMAHCRLGLRGATALGQALSVNTKVARLNLRNNGLDGDSVEEIIKGIMTATGAKLEARQRNLEGHMAGFDKIAERLASAEKQAAAMVHGRPSRAASRLDNIPHHDQAELNAKRAEEEKAGGGGEGGDAERPAVTHAQALRAASLVRKIYSRLEELDLSDNAFGLHGARLIADLINPNKTPHQFLKRLVLSNCAIPEAGGLEIVAALAESQPTLAVLDLSHNTLANKCAHAIGTLMQDNVVLRDVNLSWNEIKPEGFKAICEGVQHNDTLTKLDLSWNCAEEEGMAAVGELLSGNTTLTHLDCSHTNMTGTGTLLIAHGIRANNSLVHLELAGNMIGRYGARHLIKALFDAKVLTHLGLGGANLSAGVFDENAPETTFNCHRADGTYALDLAKPTQRAVAIRLCQLDLAATIDLMKNIRVDGKGYQSVKSAGWPASLPVKGVLACDFSSHRLQRGPTVLSDAQFDSLLAQMTPAGASDRQRLDFIVTFAPFTFLTCKQAGQMLATFGVGMDEVHAALTLFTRATDAETDLKALLGGMSDERDVHLFYRYMGHFAHTRFANPTGHYELSLSQPLHRYIAVRLREEAKLEPECANWVNVRHEIGADIDAYGDSYGPPQEWQGVIPRNGELVFDFVACAPPPAEAQPIADDALRAFLQSEVGVVFAKGKAVAEIKYGQADQQIALLRRGSHAIHVSGEQAAMVVRCFVASPHRVEALVILYGRLVSKEEVWKPLYVLSPVEQAVAINRLGPQHVYNPKHATMHWVLDCSQTAHEDIAKKLVAAAVAGGTVPNIFNLRVRGSKVQLSENNAMWASLTADSEAPLLEFDFMGPDSWELLGLTEADMKGKKEHDRIEMRIKQASRLELLRNVQFFAHCQETAGYEPPDWAAPDALKAPLGDKSPWLAAWDRVVRLVVRYAELAEALPALQSYFEDLFINFVDKQSFALKLDALQTMLKEQGFSAAEVAERLAASAQLVQARAAAESQDVAVPASMVRVVTKTKADKKSKKKDGGKDAKAAAEAAAAADAAAKAAADAVAAKAAEEAAAEAKAKAEAEAQPTAAAAAGDAPTAGEPVNPRLKEFPAIPLPSELNYSQFIAILLCNPALVLAEARAAHAAKQTPDLASKVAALRFALLGVSRSQPTPRGRKNAGIAGSEAAATSDVGSSPPGDNGEPSDGETLEATGRGWSEVGEGTGLLEGQGEGADGEEPAVMVYDGGEGAAPAAEDPAAEGADEGSAEGSAEGGAQEEEPQARVSFAEDDGAAA